MKLRLIALPIVAAGLALGGCTGHHHDRDTSYHRNQSQNTTPPPPPATIPDNNSNTPSPQYPATGGSR